MLRTQVQVHDVDFYDGCTDVEFNPIPASPDGAQPTNATLSGTHQMVFLDQDLREQFKIGNKFYLELTEVVG